MTQFTLCSFLGKKWKYAVLASLVAGAVMAPSADVKTMLIYASSILALYGLGVGVAWLL